MHELLISYCLFDSQKLIIYLCISNVFLASTNTVMPAVSNLHRLLWCCYVPYHHVTPEHIICLPVCISRPDTTGTHPAARGMSGPFRKDLDNSQYFGTPSRMVGYSLYLGTTSDDTICLSFLIPTHMFFMIFYLMLFITISPDLFHLKHSFSIYTYLCLPVT